jgi:hypothetical protein
VGLVLFVLMTIMITIDRADPYLYAAAIIVIALGLAFSILVAVGALGTHSRRSH